MEFIKYFLQASIVIFAFSLAASWVSLLIGESRLGRKNKANSMLTFIIAGILVISILYANSQFDSSVTFLFIAWLLLVIISASRLSYERNYEFSHFVKGFVVKVVVSVIVGFLLQNSFN